MARGAPATVRDISNLPEVCRTRELPHRPLARCMTKHKSFVFELVSSDPHEIVEQSMPYVMRFATRRVLWWLQEMGL